MSQRRWIARLASDAGRTWSLGGKLQGASKQSNIAAVEELRKAILKWPAYVVK